MNIFLSAWREATFECWQIGTAVDSIINVTQFAPSAYTPIDSCCEIALSIPGLHHNRAHFVISVRLLCIF